MSELNEESGSGLEGGGLEIAIIGLACRVPGAKDADTFWQNLVDGVESITMHSDEALRQMGENPALLEHPAYVRAARVLAGAEDFDAAFFGSSPREAEILDPQQRQLMECAWEALENAGYEPQTYEGLIGIYAGSRLSNYLFNLYSNPHLVESMGEFQLQTANDKDYVATRVAYKLGLGGPAVNVQTACSTSLVATHLACQALLAGECDMALAGGVGIKAPQVGYLFREGEIYSRDGHVRAFDARATGTIFGSGLGLVVLKRLEDALADGDTVRAVLRGSAINNDASLKVGFTAPAVEGQARVIRAAHLAAEVDPETITYVEAHGTGTVTGDPIEVSALTRAFREATARRGFCGLGSVKSNVGHLGAAAGVTSLIKVVYALENRLLPQSICFDEPNPKIDFAASPFFVQQEPRPWRPNGAPLRAGVSSFGIGGTNAHAVVEEAPAQPPSGASRPAQLLVVSARTESALDRACERLADHLEKRSEQRLADVAFTLQCGRRAFEQRRTLVVGARQEAIDLLRQRPPQWVRTALGVARERRVVFLFSGQGSQYPGMGAGLYRTEEVFRREVDRCAAFLTPHLGLDLRPLLFAETGVGTGVEDAAARLQETRLTQPALFVVEYALAKLWCSWGVEPEAMLGHSIGEYVAACLGGVFRLEDALLAVAARGRLMQALPTGAMASVPMRGEDLAPLLGPELEIAVWNAHDRLAVSGPEAAIEALIRRLAEQKVQARRIHTSHAFHSAMMEPALEPFLAELSRLPLAAPRIPFVSNVTGTWIRDEEAMDPGYWALHLRRAVRFAEGLEEVLRDQDRVLLEVGPGNALTTLGRRHPARGAVPVLSSLRRPQESGDDQEGMLDTLGQLWLGGVVPVWRSFYAAEERRRVPLPTYPFEHRRYWVPMGSGLSMLGAAGERPRPLEEWFFFASWRPSLAPLAAPPAADHDTTLWLLFDDDPTLASWLTSQGRAVVRVVAGKTFQQRDADTWELDPGDRQGYDHLFASLLTDGRPPRRIFHRWGITGSARPTTEVALERGFYSVLFLAQACLATDGADTVHLAVVVDGLVHLEQGDVICPAKAAVLGPCQVLPREQSRLRLVTIDVGAAEACDGPRLVAEIEAAKVGATVVAWRRGQRFERGHERVTIDRVDDQRPRLREGGVYLITGGLGSFGLAFAEDLARRQRARLVLLGRSGLPQREAWADWVEHHGEAERTSRRIRKVEALEALGAEVMVVSVDVTDGAAMAAVVAAVRQRFGALHGVIHAAGVPGGGLAATKTRDAAAAVLAPKIAGTEALAAALEGEELDFLVLCSSTIAVLGTFGQVDYCGANCFLDAFAEARAGAKSWTVSINWGAWRDVGMAAETAAPSALTLGQGKRTETRTEAGTPGGALDEVVATHGPHQPLHPLLNFHHPGEHAYTSVFAPTSHWILDEHRIGGRPAVPGTTYLEMARAAFVHHRDLAPEAGVELRDVFFLQPLMMAEDEDREVRLVLEDVASSEQAAGCRFRVSSRLLGTTPWTDHAAGQLRVVTDTGEVPAGHRVEDIRGRCPRPMSIVEGLGSSSKLVSWGPRWQCLERVDLGEGEGLAELHLGEEFLADLEGLGLHPALLDVATALTSGLSQGGSFLPLSYHRVVVYRPLPAVFYSHLRLHGDASGNEGETLSADITLFDQAGDELVAIDGFTMKRVGDAAARLAAGQADPAAATAGGAAGRVRPEGLFAAGGMRAEDGVEALRRVLSRLDAPRVVVTNKDFEQQLADAAAAATPRLPGDGVDGEERHPRPHLSTPYEAPRDGMESTLAVIWQSVLGLEEVGVHDNFFELGGDSVLGITVIAQAQEAGVALSPEQLFNHPTVGELAKVVGAAQGVAESAAADPAGADPAAADPAGAEGDLAPEQIESILTALEALS